MTAFTGLGALGHLDLQFLRTREVFARHAEPTGSNLLDRGTLRIAIGHRDIAIRILAAFTGVGLAADPIHGDGQSLMRFLGDRSIGHGATLETLHDTLRRLHLLNRNGITGFEFEHTAQRAHVFALLIDELGEVFEFSEIARTRGLLQVMN